MNSRNLLNAALLIVIIGSHAMALNADTTDGQSIPYQLAGDVGVYPFHNGVSGGWEPRFAARIGLGKDLHLLSVWAFGEYIFHTHSALGGLNDYLVSAEKRYDFALYVSTVFLGHFSLSGGVYYSKQGAVVRFSRSDNREIRTESLSHVRFYYSFGIQHTFHLHETVTLHLGAYYRNQEYTMNTFPLSLKVGVTTAL